MTPVVQVTASFTQCSPVQAKTLALLHEPFSTIIWVKQEESDTECFSLISTSFEIML